LNFHSGYSSKRIISAVKRVQFISDRKLCIGPGGHWCDIIVRNVHASVENKTNDFYEELEHLFDQFCKYYMKILLGDLNVKVHIEKIFSDQQLGTKVNGKLIMIMGLEE
jgi:hypothetical protein